jgi:SAM-dependent methyltransferase
VSAEVIWHDVECGGYAADLPLWEELAKRGGPILELGCGTGRVVLHLARTTGELVIGLDHDDSLVEAVWNRGSGFSGDAEIDDVRAFELHERFALVIAPMQLIQLLPERIDRVCCLSCVADHLTPGGRAAFSLVEELPSFPADAVAAAAPDVRQLDDWVYSSLPLPPEPRDGAIALRRLRQTVAPDGAFSEEMNEVFLQVLSAETVEQEAIEVGLTPVGRRQIPATEAHVGSTVVLLEKGN